MPAAELLVALVESSADAIFAKDLDGTIRTWNRGAERLYGYCPEEVIGRHASLLLPPERIEEETQTLARVRAGSPVDHLESVRLRRDGSRISVALAISPIRDANGDVVGASDVARNITERTLMEAATAHLAAIISSSDDAIVSKNLDGIILTWNRGAERVYGYTAEEVRWRHMSLLLPPGRPDEEAEILEKLKRGERVEHFETVRMRKDGRPIEVSLTISPIRDNDGTVRGASHIARDITDQKQLQQQLLDTQKLESLGVLAGGVAHDFNNLLVGILANASLVAGSLPESDPRSQTMAQVVMAAERAAGLTRQLLTYAGKGRAVTEPVDIAVLIREINSLVHANIPPNVQVDLDLKDGLPAIEGDSGQLQQVVMNLVINAAEAIGDKSGRVAVNLTARDLDEDFIQTMWGGGEISPGRYTVIEVQDNGSGMDEETLRKIFDPFFTTKFAGRGLGLAAVLGIVRGHKGALKVYSVPGAGTTFRVFLPAARAKLPETPPRADTSSLAGQGTILIIDDEAIVLKAARLSLQRFGYRVLAAESSLEGVEMFRRSAHDIRLVLLDMTMPGMTGEEVMRELQVIRPSVQVLLSSGFDETEAVSRFAGRGLAGFLQKPYTSRTLAAKVKELLA